MINIKRFNHHLEKQLRLNFKVNQAYERKCDDGVQPKTVEKKLVKTLIQLGTASAAWRLTKYVQLNPELIKVLSIRVQ